MPRWPTTISSVRFLSFSLGLRGWGVPSIRNSIWVDHGNRISTPLFDSPPNSFQGFKSIRKLNLLQAIANCCLAYAYACCVLADGAVSMGAAPALPPLR